MTKEEVDKIDAEMLEWHNARVCAICRGFREPQLGYICRECENQAVGVNHDNFYIYIKKQRAIRESIEAWK